MQNGYYQATGAMVTQFNRLNVISNNLANVNTIGFKKDDVVIGDFKRIYKEFQDELPIDNHKKKGAKFLNATIDRVPQISEQYIDFIAGGIKATENPLDFAIKRNDVFFLVETPNGPKLTQNGSFSLNEDGELITKEGYAVLPANYFQTNQKINIPQDSRLTVDNNGVIYVNDEEITRFFIAQPKEIRNLKKEGDNLYTLNNLDELNELEDSNSITQGFLQISNVNPVTEMVSLIETNRMVEMYQKVMTSHMNDLNQDAITKLAAVKV